VAVASALGVVAIVAALLLDTAGAWVGTSRGEPIARLAHFDCAVRCRAAGTLVWERAEAEQPLVAGDAVFVQPGGAATIAFSGGAVVELDERSLVVVEPPEPQGDRVQVVSGAVVASAGSTALAIQSGSERALVAPGGAVAVGGGAPLEVLEGRARVGAEDRGTSPRIPLLSPERGFRVYVGGYPSPVVLRWDGAAAARFKLEVSRERSFATCAASAPGSAALFELAVDGPGPWYWRIADGDGRAVSEVRKFIAVTDLPPHPFAPASGEIVLATPGVQVPFWWTAAVGAARYRVEVAADAAFQRIDLSEPASGPGVWAALELPEGVYHWRVRAERSKGQLSPPSQPLSFRLIHRQVLDAPQLFDAAIERGDHAR
jgi:hypothetical protein